VVVVSPVHIDPPQRWVNVINGLGCDIILVDDSNGKVNRSRFRSDVKFYDYEEQEKLLKEKYKGFEVFHKSSSCKNFGHWIASLLGYDVILGIDSDCIPCSGFVYSHLAQISRKEGLFSNPIGYGWYPRGYPYWARDKEVVCNMGLWRGELDINGKDKLTENPPEETVMMDSVVSHFVPFSGMNWALKTEWLPCLLFLNNWDYRYPECNELNFRRHDDIWGGYIFQKFLEKAGVVMTYGYPEVWHYTIVNPEEDAREEEAMNHNDKYFRAIVDRAFEDVKPGTPKEMLMQFNPQFEGTAFEGALQGINWWKDLWR